MSVVISQSTSFPDYIRAHEIRILMFKIKVLTFPNIYTILAKHELIQKYVAKFWLIFLVLKFSFKEIMQWF